MRDTDAEVVAPGLIRLTRRDTGVCLWLAMSPGGKPRFSYCKEDAWRWYAGAPTATA